MKASSTPSIQRLPPELMGEIFKALAPPRHPTWLHETSMDDPRRVSHVCSSWRAISLRLKSLWTSIPIVNELWAGLSIDRSRPLPIAIQITLDMLHVDEKEREKVPIYDLHDGLQKALSEPHRICALQVELSTYRFGPTGTWLAHKLMTFLEAAEVSVLEYLDVIMQFHFMHSSHPSFLGHLPPANLRYISFCGLYQGDLPCIHLLSAPLTTLDLGCGFMWESMHDALDALSRIPTLETLAIRRDRDDMFWTGAIPSYDLLDPDIEPRSVSLPNLKRLYLHEPLELIACLVRSLAFPTSAVLNLHDANDEADEPLGASVRDCLDVLTTGLNAHYGPLIAEGRLFRGLFLFASTGGNMDHQHRLKLAADHSLRDEDLADERAYLMSDHINRDISPRLLREKCPLHLSLCSDSSFAVLELVRAMTSLPIVREAHALIFFDDASNPKPEPFSAASPSQWGTALQSLDSIRVAHLRSHVAVHHLEAIIDNDMLSVTDLIIEDISFLPEPLPFNQDLRRPAHVSFDRFMFLLRRRIDPDRLERITKRLTHVELIYCDIDEAQIVRLRREFSDNFISWDGLTRGSGSRGHAAAKGCHYWMSDSD